MTNGFSLRKGHTLLANLVISGEVPMALNVYQYKAEQLKNDGAPIDWLAIPPAVARFRALPSRAARCIRTPPFCSSISS